jgi:hypothetical protein
MWRVTNRVPIASRAITGSGQLHSTRGWRGLTLTMTHHEFRKHRVAPRPILIREVRRPLRHERGLPLATEGDEGEDVRAIMLPDVA